VPGLRVGQGTSQYLFNTYTGRRLEIKDGGGPVSPVTTAGPTLKVSRTENYPSPVGGNSVDNEANAAIYGISANTANSAQQVNGVYGAAISNSGLKTDAVGLTGIGQTRVGNGVGTGLYAEGRRDSGTASVVGAEIRASNMQGGNVDYVANGFSPVMGLWVTCGAHPNPLRCGAGIALRGVPPDGQPPSAGISQWDVGIGFTTGSITSAAVRDDSGATASYYMSGTHIYGIDTAPAAISAAAIRLGNSHQVSARNAQNTADIPLLALDGNNRVNIQNGKVLIDSGSGQITISGNLVAFATSASPAVFGTSSAASGTGVVGTSSTGIGVYGATSGTGSYGVLGNAFGPSSIAVAGSTNADGASAFSGGTTNANAYAGYFQGHVVVAGPFDVSGMGNKHGVAPHPDGTHRTFYSVESPECWVEDFGTGTLAGGKADVRLDADFATLTHTDDYHVFITEHGGTHHHLSVATKTGVGFTVEADHELAKVKGKNGSDLAGTFSYRVVAKPKTTAKVERLAKATLPNLPLPPMPKVPAPPEPPKKP